ncbi:hypothetical protein [Candidatus Palauibacter sp.]|uniref:hypothetical protein n=1 Tax=Candidatus Palauibacter sp. TaxID=3101350 RepID=UPI003AF2D438
MGIRQAGSVELLTSLSVAAVLSGAACLACGDGASVGVEPGAPVEFAASTIEVLGSSDVLAVVRDLGVLSDGSVWVLNSSAPYFVGFGPDGESLGAHGRAGRGPDEFAMPSAFVAGGWEGEAWVLDLVRHAMIRISRPDADWTEIPLRSEALPPGSVRTGMSMLTTSVRTARLGREIIVPRSSGSMADGVLRFRLSLLRADLVAFDPEAGAVRDLVALGDALDDPSGDFIRSDGGFPLWYRLWASCGDNLVRVYDRARNQLRGFDGSGAEAPPIDLPPVPFTEVNPRQFAAAVFALRQAEVTGDVATRLAAEDSLRLLDQMARRVRGEPHELASYLPRYVDFRCSEDATMWLQPLDLDAGGLSGGRLWLRIATDGTAREVRLPDRFDAYRFSDSRVWGVYRDEFDRPSVASISLPMSP